MIHAIRLVFEILGYLTFAGTCFLCAVCYLGAQADRVLTGRRD